MIEHEAERLRSAYRKAVEAVEELRGALAAAGLLPATEPPVQAPGETPEERRRRLARERSRRRRARDAVTVERDAEPVTSRGSVTRSRSKRDASVTKRDAVTLKRDAAPSRVRAFLIGESISPPVFSREIFDLSRKDTPPLKTEGEAMAHPESIDAERTAEIDSDRPEGDGRERPALRSGSTIDPSPVSPAVLASDRAPEGASGDSGLVLLPGVPEEPAGVTVVWSAYLTAIAPTRARLTAARRQVIERRLREYPVEELVRAVRGYGRSAWHRGENDRGRPYQALELWLRDAAHVEAGWTLLDARSPAPKPTKKGAPELDGMNAEWQRYEARIEADRDVFADV